MYLPDNEDTEDLLLLFLPAVPVNVNISIVCLFVRLFVVYLMMTQGMNLTSLCYETLT